MSGMSAATEIAQLTGGGLTDPGKALEISKKAVSSAIQKVDGMNIGMDEDILQKTRDRILDRAKKLFDPSTREDEIRKIKMEVEADPANKGKPIEEIKAITRERVREAQRGLMSTNPTIKAP
jgi:hypothetical protein